VEWIGNRGLTEVQVEMVGLRNLYEEHHNGSMAPTPRKTD